MVGVPLLVGFTDTDPDGERNGQIHVAAQYFMGLKLVLGVRCWFRLEE